MFRRHDHYQSVWPKILILFLMVFHSSTHAGLIAFDLHNNQSLNLLNYNNPHEGAFSHSVDDTFQKHQQGVSNISDGLLDNSKNRRDGLGLIESDRDVDEFFAVQDLNNINNPSGRATASWIFDIEASNSLSLSLDVAAMGDFELSDWFRWDYAIDDFERRTLFEFNSEQSQTQSYQMASGAIVSLDDPLVRRQSLGNSSLGTQSLDNHFRNFTAPILGTGFELKLFFTAQQNGGNEVFAFRNLRVEGERSIQNQVAVSSPSTAPLILLGVCGLWFNRRNKQLLNRSSQNTPIITTAH